jgi:fatty acid kinase
LPTDQIILLPNNSNVIMTARQAAELSTKQVMVVPTRTIPQGIAAQLAFNAQAGLAANAAAMELAAGATQTGEVTVATRAAEINGIHVQTGQLIGLLNDNLTAAGQTIEEVIWQLLDQMAAQSREIVTLYYGNGVSSKEAEALSRAIRERFPSLEVEVVEGGQPHYHYILSAE